MWELTVKISGIRASSEEIAKKKADEIVNYLKTQGAISYDSIEVTEIKDKSPWGRSRHTASTAV